jgi:hypothetical protein
MQGLVVLGVVVLGDDKPVLPVIVALLLLVIVVLLLLLVGVVSEGCQCPPHDLGAQEALECGPCFVLGHAPLNSKGQSGCCRDVVVRTHPCATVSASCANFAPDSSGRQGSAPTLPILLLSKSSLLTLTISIPCLPLAGALDAPVFLGPSLVCWLARSSGLLCLAVMAAGFAFMLCTAYAFLQSRQKRNCASPPYAFLRVVPSLGLFLGILSLLTPPSSLAARGGF